MVFSWGLFLLPTFCTCSFQVKKNFGAKWPNHYKWYRLIYSIFSSILFLGILIQAIYLPLEYIFSPGRFSNMRDIWSQQQVSLSCYAQPGKYRWVLFFGFRPDSTADSSSELVISGIYSQIRHPLYLGLLGIFLGYFLVAGTVGALIHLGCLIAYLPIGIYFEEKKSCLRFWRKLPRLPKGSPHFLPKIP